MVIETLLPRVFREATDEHLLARFKRERDETAFAELVRRHGPLVLGVCRRVISDRHLADDAFQATFVVLARKADTVRPSDPLPNWLYGVAYKVSLRARAMASRRANRETLMANPPDRGAVSPALAEMAETSAIIDDEIAQLPENHRSAVVLCELQGVSRREAARQLGIAEGTLSSRLAAARKRLAVRLGRRGLALSAGLVASEQVTTQLVAATVRSALQEMPIGVVTTLTEGVMRTMLLAQLKLVPVVAMLGAILAVSFSGWEPTTKTATAAPAIKDSVVDGIIWTFNPKSGELTGFHPAGEKVARLTIADGEHFRGMTPDGKQIAFIGKKGKIAKTGKLPMDDPELEGRSLHLREISDKTEGIDTGIGFEPNDQFVWSPDMKSVVRSRLVKVGKVIPGNISGPTYSHRSIDLATKKETAIDLPDGHQIIQWCADGKSWLVLEYNLGKNEKLPNYRWHQFPVGAGKSTPIVDSHSFFHLALSPDGRTLTGSGHEHPVENKEANTFKWYCVNREDGKVTLIEDLKSLNEVIYLWSPDGKRIVGQAHDRNKQTTTLTLYDADGTNRRELAAFKGADSDAHMLGWFPSNPKFPRKKPREKLDPKKAGLIWLFDPRNGELTAIRADGKTERAIQLFGSAKGSQLFLGLTVDGRQAMIAAKNGEVPNDSEKADDLLKHRKLTLHLRPISNEGKLIDTGIDVQHWDLFVTSRDSSKIVRTRSLAYLMPIDGEAKQTGYETIEFDLKKGKSRTIPLPENFRIIEQMPDGSWLLNKYENAKPVRSRFFRSSADRKKQTLLSGEAEVPYGSISPDGRTLLVTDEHSHKTQEGDSFCRLSTIDLASGKIERIEAHRDTPWIHGFWSPSGNRIVYQRYESITDPEQNVFSLTRTRTGEASIMVCDPDGQNPQLIRTIPETPKLQSITEGPYVLGWFPPLPRVEETIPPNKAKEP